MRKENAMSKDEWKTEGGWRKLVEALKCLRLKLRIYR